MGVEGVDSRSRQGTQHEATTGGPLPDLDNPPWSELHSTCMEYQGRRGKDGGGGNRWAGGSGSPHPGIMRTTRAPMCQNTEGRKGVGALSNLNSRSTSTTNRSHCLLGGCVS